MPPVPKTKEDWARLCRIFVVTTENSHSYTAACGHLLSFPLVLLFMWNAEAPFGHLWADGFQHFCELVSGWDAVSSGSCVLPWHIPDCSDLADPSSRMYYSECVPGGEGLFLQLSLGHTSGQPPPRKGRSLSFPTCILGEVMAPFPRLYPKEVKLAHCWAHGPWWVFEECFPLLSLSLALNIDRQGDTFT
jgi:hypothetical protein